MEVQLGRFINAIAIDAVLLAFFLIILVCLSACNDAEPQVYTGKVDSGAIGLKKIRDTYKADSALKADSVGPVMPIGLIIDTGLNNPFADDSAYIPAPKPLVPRNNRP